MEKHILASVGGLVITTDDVDEFIANLGARGQNYNTADGRAMILNQLIDAKLLLLDARRNLMEGEADFRARLAKLKDDLLVNYAAEKAIMTAAPATDAEAEKFYNENPERFIGQDTVNASHILVDTEERALEILADIAADKISFEDAAKEYSSCPSKENGGNLGDFGKGQMVPEFDEAVFAMSVGEISASPVKTQFGYHLIKLNSKSIGEKTPFEQVREGIKNMLYTEKQRAAYDSKINQLKILYPVDRTI